MINPKSVPLDPNHSHFILVDNHCGGELGHDLLFRLHLETELRKYTSENSFMDEPSIAFSSARKSSVGETSNLSVSIGSGKNDADAKKSHEKFDTPSILICVNGGYDALCLIDESMKQEIPILILLVGFINYDIYTSHNRGWSYFTGHLFYRGKNNSVKSMPKKLNFTRINFVRTKDTI
jgi:hypothetical protein